MGRGVLHSAQRWLQAYGVGRTAMIVWQLARSCACLDGALSITVVLHSHTQCGVCRPPTHLVLHGTIWVLKPKGRGALRAFKAAWR
jgi:hypothetical protein